MKVQRDDNGKVTVFAEGRIDTNAAPQFAAEMEQALEGARDLVLDFSRLVYISSSGLRPVMLAIKAMGRQGTMRIIGVNDGIYDILETTGFVGVCDVERK
ncbi:MAG: STAS domain-containing protein [Oscillospiraceae bacterium]|nr:STAS domain-containing protein [Oscillospiraceae bacterium]